MILQGDSNSLILELEDNSVDMVLTDPPYNISRDNNFSTMGRASIDFGEWDKDFNLVEYIEEATRVLKKGGNIVVFTDWKKVSVVVDEMEKQGLIIKDMLRMTKTNPMPRNRDRRFVTDYEIAVWAVKKGGKWTFNRQSDTYERPEIVTSVTPKGQKTHGSHPTQKNIFAMEHIIKILSNENDTILDMFAGTGTTGVAAQNLNRKYILMEIDEKNIETIKKRLA